MLIHALLLVSLGVPKVDLDVVYSKAGGETLMMDVYYPANNGATDSLAPAVLVIHGGAWMSGRRQDVGEFAKTLSDQGFLAATTSYRLAPKHKWPAMLDDVQTAVRYLRANASKYGIDPRRIGSTGFSAGGHLSLLLGFRETRDSNPTEYPRFSSKTQAVLNVFGPTDFRRDFAPGVDSIIETVLGKKKADATEDIRQACPVEWIAKGSAPVYTIQGDADPLVPFAQAKWLKEKLDAAGIKNEMVIVPKMAHGVDKTKPEQLKAMVDGANWLKKQLGL